MTEFLDYLINYYDSTELCKTPSPTKYRDWTIAKCIFPFILLHKQVFLVS